MNNSWKSEQTVAVPIMLWLTQIKSTCHTRYSKRERDKELACLDDSLHKHFASSRFLIAPAQSANRLFKVSASALSLTNNQVRRDKQACCEQGSQNSKRWQIQFSSRSHLWNFVFKINFQKWWTLTLSYSGFVECKVTWGGGGQSARSPENHQNGWNRQTFYYQSQGIYQWD